MENTIITGNIKFNKKTYEAELTNHTLHIKTDFNQNFNKAFIQNTIEFIPQGKFEHSYVLYIDKVANSSYHCVSFNVLLLYRKWKDKQTCFEIESAGFVNAVNAYNKLNELDINFILEKLNKEFLKFNVKIRNNDYICSFVNYAKRNDNSLFPYNFVTVLRAVPKDGIYENKIKDIYDFSIALLQFVTLNSYSTIDNFAIYNSIGGFSEIEIFTEHKNIGKNDKYIKISELGGSLPNFLACFPDGMIRQYNFYHFNNDYSVYDFDIVRLSGSFEDVFRENIEKREEFNSIVIKKKEEIHFDELKKEIKAFAKKYKIFNKKDFYASFKIFEDYGGTLKDKLVFALESFCVTMDYIIIDMNMSWIYSPAAFETRIKDARNAICHGLHTKKIDWKNAATDTFVLQELIYFIILKYKVKIEDKKIRKCIEASSFSSINKKAFFSRNDKRIRWEKK